MNNITRTFRHSLLNIRECYEPLLNVAKGLLQLLSHYGKAKRLKLATDKMAGHLQNNAQEILDDLLDIYQIKQNSKHTFESVLVHNCLQEGVNTIDWNEIADDFIKAATAAEAATGDS
jgi:hypothetical protein